MQTGIFPVSSAVVDQVIGQTKNEVSGEILAPVNMTLVHIYIADTTDAAASDLWLNT